MQKINMKNTLLFLLILLTPFLSSAESIDGELFNKYLSDGRQDALEDLLKEKIKKNQVNSEEIYFYAVLMRSRFDCEIIPRILPLVKGKLSDSREAALGLIVKIDSRNDEEYAFLNLMKLIDAVDDNSILWLAGISCRELKKNLIGKIIFDKLSKKWSPGPILLHQTFANILDDLGEFDQALVHRQKAMEMKETSWNLDAYGNTLSKLKRYDEAEAAYRKSLKIKNNPRTLLNLGICLCELGKYEGAELALRECLGFDNDNADAHGQLGNALFSQEKYNDAELEYKFALKIDAGSIWIHQSYENLLRKIGRVIEADQINEKWKSIISGLDRAP